MIWLFLENVGKFLVEFAQRRQVGQTIVDFYAQIERSWL